MHCGGVEAPGQHCCLPLLSRIQYSQNIFYVLCADTFVGGPENAAVTIYYSKSINTSLPLSRSLWLLRLYARCYFCQHSASYCTSSAYAKQTLQSGRYGLFVLSLLGLVRAEGESFSGIGIMCKKIDIFTVQ